jgi:hypothetical protein
MAQWKKIVVSGSDISQLNNDVNYVVNAGSNGVGLTGAFTGSFSGSAVLPALTQGTSVATFTYNGSAPATVGIAANGITATQLDNAFTDGGGLAGAFGSSTQVPVLTIDEQGRITTASLSTISTTLGISGDTGTDSVSLIDGTLDFEGTNGITTTVSDDKVTFALTSGVISGSTFTSPNQGTLRSTLNGVATDIDLGLQTTDNVTFGSLVVTNDTTIDGNLTVNGDLTTLNTTNKAIKDKFILLNSGSTDPDEGGLVIDEGNGTGHAFLYDGDDGRWGVTATLNATASAADTEAYVALVVHEDDINHDVNDAEYAKVGNIKVDSSGNIFMYT